MPFWLDEHVTRAACAGIATEDEAPTDPAVIAAANGHAPLPPNNGPRDALRGAGARPAARHGQQSNDSVAGGGRIRSGRGLQDSGDFSCVDISSILSSVDNKFFGAAMAGNGLVVFAPRNADCAGVFNAASDAFSCVSISSTLSSIDNKFLGAATAGNGRVVFVPFNADCVGVFDATSDAFSCVSISSTLSIERKFSGAATSANGLVVFAPRRADCVGVFNAASDAFSCVSIASTLSIDAKFAGAATATNGLVVFAPWYADCVGVFDATSKQQRVQLCLQLLHPPHPQHRRQVCRRGDSRQWAGPVRAA